MKSQVQEIRFSTNRLACKYYPDLGYIEIQQKGEMIRIVIPLEVVPKFYHSKRTIN